VADESTGPAGAPAPPGSSASLPATRCWWTATPFGWTSSEFSGRRQSAKVRGSPKRGSTLLSKRVIAHC